MAEGDLLPPGYLYRDDMAGAQRGRFPYPYPYATYPKYDPETALRQGTLFPWLDDHWRRRIAPAEPDARPEGTD